MEPLAMPAQTLWQRRRSQVAMTMQLPPPSMLSLEVIKGPYDDQRRDSSAEIEAAGYLKLDILGQGATSVVYAARRLSDGRALAMKQMCTSQDAELESFARREYELLRSLQHPNIISVFDFFTLSGRSVLIMEHFQGRDLSQAVAAVPGSRLSEARSRRLALGLFDAVAYLHRHEVVHRDIKNQNVLVDDALETVKLVDFNASCNLNKNSLALTPTGSPLFSSPEVLVGDSPGQANDVWCAGMCLYFMLAGRLPQRRSEMWDTTRHDMAARPILVSGPLWEHISEQGKEVVEQTLALQEQARPSAEEVLEFRWFSEVFFAESTNVIASCFGKDVDEFFD